MGLSPTYYTSGFIPSGKAIYNHGLIRFVGVITAFMTRVKSPFLKGWTSSPFFAVFRVEFWPLLFFFSNFWRMVALKGFGSFSLRFPEKKHEGVYVCDVWFGSFHSKNYIPENAIKHDNTISDGRRLSFRPWEKTPDKASECDNTTDFDAKKMRLGRNGMWPTMHSCIVLIFFYKSSH